MKIGIISGSHRKASESSRVGRYFESLISDKASVFFLELASEKLPFIDEDVLDKTESWKKKWTPISTELSSCDGFIIISPEYGGMASPAIKNFFLLCSGGELSHKPALPVGVSSSRGGSYPISELRMSGYKNTRICYIPEQIIVRDSGSMLKGNSPASDSDEYLRNRIQYSVNILLEYARAMLQVRLAGVIDHKSYPNGM